MTNGSAGAAILAGGAGCCLLGMLSCAADLSKNLAVLMVFYPPAGPLSGVTTVSSLLWLATWFILARRWRDKTVAIGKVNAAAFALVGFGLLLTFPPFVDCLPGR